MTQRRTRSRLAPLALVAMLISACGSQLTEQQVLARSGSGTVGSPGAPQPTGGPGSNIAQPSSAPIPGISSGPTLGPGAGPAGGPTSGPLSGPQTSHGPNTGSGPTPCTTRETGPIKVASVGTYSGPAGSSLDNFPKAVQLWATMINSHGGICGRQVQVLVGDDGGDPARYGSLVRDMVQNQHVVAFVGNGATLTYQGGLAYHNQSGVPVFGNDCGAPEYFTSPVIAPTCPLFKTAIVGMVKNGVDLTHKTHFGYVYCREAQSCATGDQLLKNGAVKAGGAQLVYRKDISISQVDFTAECQNARAADADLFAVGADAATLSRVAQGCANQGWSPQYVAVALAFGADSISNPPLKNVIVTEQVFPFSGGSGGAIDEYNQVRQTYGPNITPSPALAYGWAGAKLFELVANRAARAAGSISPQTLVTALHTVKNTTLGGLTVNLSFDAQGTHAANCFFVMQGDGTGRGFKLPFGSKPRCL
jgi:branched-chain amino acid transport system substrate-binding protein